MFPPSGVAADEHPRRITVPQQTPVHGERVVEPGRVGVQRRQPVVHAPHEQPRARRGSRRRHAARVPAADHEAAGVHPEVDRLVRVLFDAFGPRGVDGDAVDVQVLDGDRQVGHREPPGRGPVGFLGQREPATGVVQGRVGQLALVEGEPLLGLLADGGRGGEGVVAHEHYIN